MWHFEQRQKWQWQWQRRQWWWQRRQWLQKTVTAEASLKDWLQYKDTVERLTLYQYKNTVERLTLYQYENTVERLTLYQYKISFTKSSFFLHTYPSQALETFHLLSSYLLIFLSSYLLTFISFHHCTIWQSYNLTILFTLFTTNFLDYSAWLLTFSPTTAKYFKKLFHCEYHTFCK
jgi:hypothetical protein